MINGSVLEPLMCERLQGILDVNADYTPETFVALVSANSLSTFNDLIAWMMNQIPLYGPSNPAWGVSAWTDQAVVDLINTWHGSTVVQTPCMDCAGNIYKLYLSDPNKDTTVKQSLVDAMIGA